MYLIKLLLLIRMSLQPLVHLSLAMFMWDEVLPFGTAVCLREMKITGKPYLAIRRRRRQQQFEHSRRIFSSSSSQSLPLCSSAVLFFFFIFSCFLSPCDEERGRCWLLLPNLGLGFCSVCGLCFCSGFRYVLL